MNSPSAPTPPADQTGKQPAATSSTMRALAGIRRVEVSAAELGPGVELDGRYEITALIGEGGFGKVFSAQDSLRSREVAVKVLTLAYNQGGEQAIERFVREAEITASLVHGNTVRVFDWGMTHDGQLFLIMERLRGEALRERLDRAHAEQRTLGDHETRSIGIQTLQSLAEAHANGLVHRDLKPGNIYMHRLGGRSEVVKVIDFGIARQSGSEMTRAGQALGTPTHMSPEQAQGHEIDGRSDLYSLAVVLYECAVGQMPYYEPSSGLLTMMMHVTAPVPRVADEAPEPVSLGLAAVIERGLSKKPEDRFADAAEMRAALKAVRLPRSPHVRTGNRSVSKRIRPTRNATSSRRMPRRVSDIVANRNRPRPQLTPLTGAGNSVEIPPLSPPPSDSAAPKSTAAAPKSAAPKSPPPPPTKRPPRARPAVDDTRRRRRRLLHAADTQRLADNTRGIKAVDCDDASDLEPDE